MTSSRIYPEELTRIQKRLQGLLEQTLRAVGYGLEDGGLGSGAPPVDLVDTGSTYRLEAEVPGVGRDDVDVSIEGRTLELSGRVPPPGDEVTFLRMERDHGTFRRVFELEAPVDSEAMSAHLRHGVFTVTIPKLSDTEEKLRTEPEGDPT